MWLFKFCIPVNALPQNSHLRSLFCLSFSWFLRCLFRWVPIRISFATIQLVTYITFVILFVFMNKLNVFLQGAWYWKWLLTWNTYICDLFDLGRTAWKCTLKWLALWNSFPQETHLWSFWRSSWTSRMCLFKTYARLNNFPQYSHFTLWPSCTVLKFQIVWLSEWFAAWVTFVVFLPFIYCMLVFKIFGVKKGRVGLPHWGIVRVKRNNYFIHKIMGCEDSECYQNIF